MEIAGRTGRRCCWRLGARFALIAGGAGAGRDRRRGDRQGAGRSGRPTWRRSRRRARCATTCRGCSRRRRCRTGCRTRPPGEGRLPGAGARGGRPRRRRRTRSPRRACGSPSPTRSPSRRCGSRRSSRPIVDVGGGRPEVEASAVAEAAAPVGDRAARCRRWPAAAATAARSSTGQGEGMRPDVAAAFDRMAAAARGPGSPSSSTPASAPTPNRRRSSPPIPTRQWVAPPGHSLHRCATELDLGPESAYGWLAANASRFGFVQRYSWEAWHYGYDRRPGALLGGRQRRRSDGRCGRRAEGVGGGTAGAGGETGARRRGGLPSFVPARFRAPLLRAATRWNVSAALLAAQLMAESNFNPYAGSPAGAQGIAQFIPSTAAAYGLDDPFDPVEAIDAQAHLMSDLLRQFGDPAARPRRLQRRPGPGRSLRLHPRLPRDPGLRKPNPRPARRRRRPRRADLRSEARRMRAGLRMYWRRAGTWLNRKLLSTYVRFKELRQNRERCSNY